MICASSGSNKVFFYFTEQQELVLGFPQRHAVEKISAPSIPLGHTAQGGVNKRVRTCWHNELRTGAARCQLRGSACRRVGSCRHTRSERRRRPENRFRPAELYEWFWVFRYKKVHSLTSAHNSTSCGLSLASNCVAGRTFLHPQRLCSGEVATCGPVAAPSKPWEMDASARRRRVRSCFIRTALWAPTMGEKDSCSEASSNKTGTTPLPQTFWPGPYATEFNTL